MWFTHKEATLPILQVRKLRSFSVSCLKKIKNLSIAVRIDAYNMFMSPVKKKLLYICKLCENMLRQSVLFKFFQINSYWLGELIVSHVPSPSHVSLLNICSSLGWKKCWERRAYISNIVIVQLISFMGEGGYTSVIPIKFPILGSI